MASASDRVRDFFALDDDWARTGGISRSDVVLTLAFVGGSLLVLELMRSVGSLTEVEASLPQQWLLTALPCLFLLTRRRWPLVTAVAASTVASGTASGTISQITPAGTNDAPAFSGTQFTPTGTISQITPQGTVAAPVFSGTPHTPTFTGTAVTPEGTVSQPTFTGTQVTPQGTIQTDTPGGTVAIVNAATASTGLTAITLKPGSSLALVGDGTSAWYQYGGTSIAVA